MGQAPTSLSFRLKSENSPAQCTELSPSLVIVRDLAKSNLHDHTHSVSLKELGRRHTIKPDEQEEEMSRTDLPTMQPKSHSCPAHSANSGGSTGRGAGVDEKNPSRLKTTPHVLVSSLDSHLFRGGSNVRQQFYFPQGLLSLSQRKISPNSRLRCPPTPDNWHPDICHLCYNVGLGVGQSKDRVPARRPSLLVPSGQPVLHRQ